jgi:predicted methyltransferase
MCYYSQGQTVAPNTIHLNSIQSTSPLNTRSKYVELVRVSQLKYVYTSCLPFLYTTHLIAVPNTLIY